MPDVQPGQDLREKIYNELDAARTARSLRNEGRARVCARRAAGWALESIYNSGVSVELREANAYRFLQWFELQEHYPLVLREAARRLTTRVDEDFTLPFEQDPLDDAKKIIDWVFSDGS